MDENGARTERNGDRRTDALRNNNERRRKRRVYVRRFKDPFESKEKPSDSSSHRSGGKTAGKQGRQNDFERWIESYTQNMPIRGKKMYLRRMGEELLKAVDSMESMDLLPNKFAAAVACDLIWRLNETEEERTEETRRNVASLILHIVQHIFRCSEDDFLKAARHQRIAETLFRSTPFFEASAKLLTEIQRLQKEREKYSMEYNLIKIFNAATENMMNVGVGKWQRMTLRAVLGQWRFVCRTSKKFKKLKAKLSQRMQNIWTSTSKRETFEQWVQITRQNRFARKHGHLNALERSVDDRIRDRDALLRKLHEVESKVKTLKSRRPEFEKRSALLKERLVSTYESDMAVHHNLQTLQMIHRTREDAIHEVDDRVNTLEASHLLNFTRIELEFMKSIQIRYGLTEDINVMYRSILAILDLFADRMRDIFYYYAKGDGATRTMNETELDELLADAKVDGLKSETVHKLFRVVTIQNAQFVEGHCVLTPKTYVEMLLRIACEIDQANERRPLAKKFGRLCEKYLFTYCMRHDGDGFRMRVFRDRDVQSAILESSALLLSVFLHFGNVRTSTGSTAMCSSDFVALLARTNLAKFGFTHEIALDIFCSIQHHVEDSISSSNADVTDGEGYDPELERMEDNFATFEEFVEGIAACACFRFTNPYEPLHIKFKNFVGDLRTAMKNLGPLPLPEGALEKYASGFSIRS